MKVVLGELLVEQAIQVTWIQLLESIERTCTPSYGFISFGLAGSVHEMPYCEHVLLGR
jgi:hypothetical protein